MSFEKLYKRSSLPAMTAADRKGANILVVEPDASVRQNMRQILQSAGFANVTDATDYTIALAKLEQRGITHLIFDVKKSNLPPNEFLTKVLEMEPDIISIPSSYEPTLDNVFDLLVLGARGYLVKPFNQQSLDDSMVMATKGEPLSDSILYAKNRNEALASLMVTALDKLAVVMRQAEQFATAKAELPKRVMGFKRASDIGKTFAQGGEDNLLDAIIEFCSERSKGPASRLGRLRKRLDDKKGALIELGKKKKNSASAKEDDDSKDNAKQVR